MKHLIGKSIIVRTDGININGILKSDNVDSIILTNPKKDNEKENNDTVIPKNKITMWVCDSKDNVSIKAEKKVIEAPKDAPPAKNRIPLCLLACQNKGLQCVGVRFTINKFKEDVNKTDFELFMQPCSSRQANCKYGNIGEIQEIETKLLATLMKDILIGDYPKK